ncbi:MAG TPA: hypothetical protein ENK18_11860 [Deltaproteobacteria bacterium]|nr:hypothetical protein [Deltaproteobacteria bacterium]
MPHLLRPPGSGLASVAALLRDPLEALPRPAATHGDTFLVDLLFLPVVVLSNPRDVLATLARRVSLRLEPDAQLELIPSVTLRPRGGLPMIASARELPALV